MFAHMAFWRRTVVPASRGAGTGGAIEDASVSTALMKR